MWVELMSRFVTKDGEYVGKMLPNESWWRAAIKKARINGWIKRSGIGFTFGNERVTDIGNYVWYLTEKGKTVAKISKQKMKDHEKELAKSYAEFINSRNIK